MYAGLDLKATKFERRTTEFIGDLLFFYGYDKEDLYVTYDRNLVVNELETVTIANQSRGFISEETRLKNHPWVEDPQAEMERMGNDTDPESDLDV
jgi:hypothetical protein